MTESQFLHNAEGYLSSHAIEHVRPGRIGSKEEGQWEAIFLIPAALNPVVAAVDPQDVRVWVTVPGGQVEWIHQM